VDSFAGLQIGDLVALSTETLQNAPWTVQVTGTEGEKISIVRMEGEYNSSIHTLQSCVGHLQLVQALQEAPLSFQPLSLYRSHAKSKFS